GLCQVRVAGRVDRTELEASAARDPYQRRPVLPAVVLVDRCPEPEVPEALVRVDRRGSDAAKAAVVVEDSSHELQPDLRQLGRTVGVVEDVVSFLVDERE